MQSRPSLREQVLRKSKQTEIKQLECVCDTANNIASPDRNEETCTRLTLLVANVPRTQSRALPLAGPTPYFYMRTRARLGLRRELEKISKVLNVTSRE